MHVSCQSLLLNWSLVTSRCMYVEVTQSISLLDHIRGYKTTFLCGSVA